MKVQHLHRAAASARAAETALELSRDKGVNQIYAQK